MRASIVPIGNSKGIRIPKIILEQCHIGRSVFLEVKGGGIVIRPVKEEPRKDWEEDFKRMQENKDDHLIINDNVDLDMEGWEWK